GDRVLAVTRFGGYVDEAVVDADRARKIPAGISLEAAAALPAQYVTAYHAYIEVARVRPGESVLVLAAAGGVGTAACQLGRHLGLRIIGAASTDEKLAFAREHGAAETINYTTEDVRARVRELTSDRGVDLVLDANGGDSFATSFDCLAPGGRLIVYGAARPFPRR